MRGRQSQQLLQLSGPKNGSFAERVIQETSDTCVDTKPKGIEATWIVSDDREQSSISLCSHAVQATKHLPVTSKRGHSNPLYTCLQTQLTTELKPKLIKKYAQKTLNTGCLRELRKNTYVSTWG